MMGPVMARRFNDHLGRVMMALAMIVERHHAMAAVVEAITDTGKLQV